MQTPGDFYLSAPANMDGSSYLNHVDVGDSISFSFTNSSRPGARFDGLGRLHFLGSMALGYVDESFNKNYWPYFSFVKSMIFDPDSMTMTMQDVYPQSACETPEFPFVPWDADQDGELEYDMLGNVMAEKGWPIWWYDWNDAFQENLYKIAASKDGQWMACVWHDGLYSRYYNENGDEDYLDWATCPEIAISISADYGDHWSEPNFMNANSSAETGYHPELAGMIPTYVYPGDIIEDLGDGHGKLHLFFLDDYSYGSYIQAYGDNDGGMLYYATLDVDFSQLIGGVPNAPQNLRIEAAGSTIHLCWSPVTGADYYRVYASDDPDAPVEAWSLAGATTANEWFCESTDDKRFYRVCAVTND